jgi:hypothetical protein
MDYKIWCRYDKTMIRVTLVTPKPTKIRLIAYDSDQANTQFINSTNIINGQEDLYIRLPLSPNNLIVKIYNEEIGNRPKEQENTFIVKNIRKEDLDVTINKTKMDTPLVNSFVKFCQKFCYNAGWMPPKDYYGNNNQFKIEYMPYIKGQNGNKLYTPARISTQNGRIQVSQEAFVPFTVPMRMAILLHEFSHYYLNSDISDEVEADLNALTIYLGLGFPIKEGYAAFGETFMGAQTELNKKIYENLNNFIRDYIKEHDIKDVYASGYKEK